MKTALECYLRAAKCDQDAEETKDDANKTGLLATAKRWRDLGDRAAGKERLDAARAPIVAEPRNP